MAGLNPIPGAADDCKTEKRLVRENRGRFGFHDSNIAAKSSIMFKKITERLGAGFGDGGQDEAVELADVVEGRTIGWL